MMENILFQIFLNLIMYGCRKSYSFLKHNFSSLLKSEDQNCKKAWYTSMAHLVLFVSFMFYTHSVAAQNSPQVSLTCLLSIITKLEHFTLYQTAFSGLGQTVWCSIKFWLILLPILNQLAWFSISTRNLIGSGQSSTHLLL